MAPKRRQKSANNTENHPQNAVQVVDEPDATSNPYPAQTSGFALLPPEILSEIIIHTLLISPKKGRIELPFTSGLSGPMSYSHICCSLRQVCFSLPSRWWNICITTTNATKRTERAFASILSIQPDSSPLSVSFRGKRLEAEAIKILRTIISLSHRWQRMEFNIPFNPKGPVIKMFSKFNRQQHPFPFLESIKIAQPYIRFTPTGIVSYIDYPIPSDILKCHLPLSASSMNGEAPAPKLREINLRGSRSTLTDPLSYPLPWGQLEAFHFLGSMHDPVGTSIKLLGRLECLRDLDLSGWLYSNRFGNPLMQTTTSIIQHDNICRLKFGDISEPIVSLLRLPSLVEVRLTRPSRKAYKTLQALIERSGCTILSLSIHESAHDSQEILAAGDNFVNWIPKELQVLRFWDLTKFEWLVRILTITEQTRNGQCIPLPQLKHLSIHRVEGDIFSDDSLIRMMAMLNSRAPITNGCSRHEGNASVACLRTFKFLFELTYRGLGQAQEGDKQLLQLQELGSDQLRVRVECREPRMLGAVDDQWAVEEEEDEGDEWDGWSPSI